MMSNLGLVGVLSLSSTIGNPGVSPKQHDWLDTGNSTL
jgi:hypothetical protein